jgi:hypothetical protein
MDENLGVAEGSREGGGDPSADGWCIVNPAVRAMLDHLAEELATEFIRLVMAASKDSESRPQKDEEPK